MDKDLWLSACATLVEARRHFEVPGGSGHGSSLNGDGTPYQIAWATDGARQAVKVIVDPFPYAAAEEQRALVLQKLAAWAGMSYGPHDRFLRQIAAMGQGEGGEARRFWVASDPGRRELEIYTSLAGKAGHQREQELGRLMERLRCRTALPVDRFQVGPVSLSAADGTLSVYMRPRNRSSLAEGLPGELASFLNVFAHSSVGPRGILVSYRLRPDGPPGFKLDLCGHCVTPTIASAIKAADALGARYRSRPIDLPAGAGVAFWGWSKTAGRERIHLYCVPAHS